MRLFDGRANCRAGAEVVDLVLTAKLDDLRVGRHERHSPLRSISAWTLHLDLRITLNRFE